MRTLSGTHCVIFNLIVFLPRITQITRIRKYMDKQNPCNPRNPWQKQRPGISQACVPSFFIQFILLTIKPLKLCQTN